MPTIAPSDKVLVTGANGYIGVWVTKLLLERGYQVRGAVRNKEKGEAFVKVIKEKVPQHVGNLEYVVVEDFTVVRPSRAREDSSFDN